VAAIEQLERSGGLDELSPARREVARARRANPELNLAELAVRMRLSKSAVNHRLRRLVEIAEGASEAEDEPDEAPATAPANGAPANGVHVEDRQPAAAGARLA